MKKLLDKFRIFMTGRYGADRLNTALLVLYFVLMGINILIWNWVISLILDVIAIALIVVMFFRMFSRNLAKRRGENEAYLRLEGRVKSFFRFQKKKFAERKTHVYKKCPKCRSNLRLPRQVGKHTVVCPKCRERFSVEIK